MAYRAFAGGKEITGFPIGDKSASEIWGGNTLLWKNEPVMKITENLSGYVSNGSCTNSNGVKMLSVLNSRSSTEGQIFGFFSENSPYISKIITNRSYNKGLYIVNYQEYFYGIVIDSGASSSYIYIKDFYKISESGEIVQHYSSSIRIQRYSGYSLMLLNFYVYNDYFFICIGKVKYSTIYECKTYVCYKGSKLRESAVSTTIADKMYFKVTDGILNTLQIGNDNYAIGKYGDIIKVSETSISKAFEGYKYLGTTGNKIFLIDSQYSKNIYELDGDKINLIYSTDNDSGKEWHTSAPIMTDIMTFSGDNIYFAQGEKGGDYNLYYYSVFKINLKNSAHANFIYKCSKYGLSDMIFKNNKLYIHKFDMRTYSATAVFLDVVDFG